MISVQRVAPVLLFVSLLLVAGGGSASAQTGGVFVRVMGAEGPISAASVELFRGQQRVIGTATDSAGVARLVGVAAATYRLRVESLGYRPRVLDEVIVRAGQAQVLSVELEAAPVEVTGVQVNADRIRAPRVVAGGSRSSSICRAARARATRWSWS